MALNLGSGVVDALKLGGSDVDKAYLGADEVFAPGGASAVLEASGSLATNTITIPAHDPDHWMFITAGRGWSSLVKPGGWTEVIKQHSVAFGSSYDAIVACYKRKNDGSSLSVTVPSAQAICYHIISGTQGNTLSIGREALKLSEALYYGSLVPNTSGGIMFGHSQRNGRSEGSLTNPGGWTEVTPNHSGSSKPHYKPDAPDAGVSTGQYYCGVATTRTVARAMAAIMVIVEAG